MEIHRHPETENTRSRIVRSRENPLPSNISLEYLNIRSMPWLSPNSGISMENPPPSNISPENTSSMSWLSPNLCRSIDNLPPPNFRSNPLSSLDPNKYPMDLFRFPPMHKDVAPELNLPAKFPCGEHLFKANPDQYNPDKPKPADKELPRMFKSLPPGKEKKLPNLCRSIDNPPPSNFSLPPSNVRPTPNMDRRSNTLSSLDPNKYPTDLFRFPPMHKDVAAELNLPAKFPCGEHLFKANPDQYNSLNPDKPKPADKELPRMFKFLPPGKEKKLPMEKPFTLYEAGPDHKNGLDARLFPVNLQELDRIRKELPDFYVSHLVEPIGFTLKFVNNWKGWKYKFVELVKAYCSPPLVGIVYLTFTAKEDDADHVDTFQAAVQVSYEEGAIGFECWDPAASV